jgi:hypothetical protein
MAVVDWKQMERLLGKSRLQMHIAVWLQVAFVAGLVVAGILSPVGITLGTMDLGLFVVVVIGVSWFSLLARSLRQGQMMQAAALLISQNRPAQAVPYLLATLEQFSLLRMNKILAMLHLARIAQGRMEHATAAMLAGEMLRRDLTRRKGLTVRTCLLLAESQMELGDADAAGEALALLHGRRLRVAEQLQVLPVLLRWQMLSGKYAEAAAYLEEKVRLAALLDAPQACLVHVLLAAATKQQKMYEASRFLLRRAALHYDLSALAERNPSAASYLVQLQVAEKPACEAARRMAHDNVACLAASQDVQQAVEDPLCD